MIDTDQQDRLIRAAQAFRRGDLSRREFQAIVLATVGALGNADIALDVLLTGEVAEVLKNTEDLLRGEELISLGSTPHLEPENEDAGAHLFNILVRRGTEAFTGLDFVQAAANVTTDAMQDWFQDPWKLPEIRWLAERGRHVLAATLITEEPPVYGKAVDVPKSSHDHRPATILDPLGRLIYQALVDAESAQLTGGLASWTFGWRVPEGSKIPGKYAENNVQWTEYLEEVNWGADLSSSVLRTDVENFFSSINTDAAIPSLFTDGAHAQYLIRLVKAWNDQTGRSGLPQRCLASSVIANGFLSKVDDVVKTEWHPDKGPSKGNVSATRWMDDFWIFSPTTFGKSEIEGPVREAIEALGLVLNESKTEWLVGESLELAVSEANFSYEVHTLESDSDPGPLIERAKSILEGSSLSRTQVRFLAKTAFHHDIHEILDLLVINIDKLSAGIDQVCRVFREAGRSSELEDWFVRTLRSSESAWVRSSLFQLLPKQTALRNDVFAAVQEAAHQDREYMVMSAALDYLSNCDPSGASQIIRGRIRDCDSAAFCRSLGLAGARAKMEPPEITRMLDLFPECFATLEMLRDMNFRLPPGDFLKN